MTNPTVFICGIDGFIGSTLKIALEKKGYVVYGSVYVREPRIREFYLDISEKSSFESLPKITFDAIINNIGIIDQSMSRRLMFAVNAKGVKNVLNWAEQTHCPHFIQISSIGVYGLRAMGQQRDETTPRTRYLGVAYQTSKAKGEEWVEKSTLPYTILRLPSVVGKGDTIITPAIGYNLKNGTYFTSGNKNPFFSILAVKNLAGVLDKVIKQGLSEPPTNSIYNVASHHLTWSELVQVYAKQLQVDIPKKKRSLLSMTLNLSDKLYLFLLTNSRFGAHFPNEKFSRTFNYKPSHTWQEAVYDEVEGLKDTG
ncbi:hypothetical protein A9Q81_13025 [Gammaproteobacteria bacterium 42_54_T18]|nr:hypothetical protein A9Q81_13025 [Gammaproteobacteria bacterium 42_54_T18]